MLDPSNPRLLIALHHKLAWKMAPVFPQEGKQSHLQACSRSPVSSDLTKSVSKEV